MRQSKRQAQVCEPVVISSDDDMGEVCNSYWKKIHGITLTEEDKQIILSGEGWLNDGIVFAAMLLMKNDADLLPVGSLQNPVLGDSLQFEVAADESVQVLNSGGSHWIAVSTVGCKHPVVRVYDSLYSKLPSETKDQIATLVSTPEKQITLEYANIQVSKS